MPEAFQLRFICLGVFKLGWDAEGARRCLQRFVRPGRHVGVPTPLELILNTPHLFA
jgi:hypothetical protein